jgi:hypothetical protein
MNPSSSGSSVRRLLPDEPFPPYSFVPGRFPHPESDPAGHSYGRERAAVAELDPARWMTNRPYLYGLDLFNAGYYWESHVEFEGLWIAAGRAGVLADFLKGLIHLAAAGVKHLEGRPNGVASHARRAGELWLALGLKEPLFLGLRVPELVQLAKMVRENGWPDAAPALSLDADVSLRS